MLGSIRHIVGVKFTLDFPLSFPGVFLLLNVKLTLNFDSAPLFYAFVSFNSAKN